MKHRNVFGGIVLILVALLILFGNKSWLSVEYVWLILTGIWFIFEVVMHRNYWSATTALAVFAWIAEEKFEVLDVDGFILSLAIFIAAAGLQMIIGSHGTHQKYSTKTERNSDVDILNIFGSTIRYLHTENIDSLNIMGTSKLYIDVNDEVVPDYVDVDLANFFGTTILYLPKNWNVEGDGVMSLFGSDNVYGDEFNQAMPTIQIEGINLFGSVRIKRI